MKNTANTDITQISLLFSTLVYFSNYFINKIAKQLGVYQLDILEINGLKAIYIRFKDNTYIAFRGTEFSLWSNSKRVLNFIPKKNLSGKRAHRGFVMAFIDLKKIIDPLIFNPKSVIFTGHSLGGALSILAAEHYQGISITFASPKVYFNENVKHKITYIGYSIKGDPITLLPPTSLFMKWSRPIPEFIWIYKTKFINYLRYHHISSYIKYYMENNQCNKSN